MIYLSNDKISVEISELGAEIKSLKKDGYEYIWSGDARVWGNTAPILFPIIGFLKDNKYTIGGEEYKMAKHGILRGKNFTVENASKTSVTMLYTDNEETRKVYPFSFEFRAVFTVNENSLSVEYSVNNKNDGEMYFSVGAHEAYATPEGVEDYDIIFEKKENLESYLMDGGLLTPKTLNVGMDTEYLPIYEKYFMLDTLIFKGLSSKSVTLRNRKSARCVKVDFPNCDYLAIWHKPSAGYLCIEPWSGLPDNENTSGNITEKEGIIRLAPHCNYSNIHTITV